MTITASDTGQLEAFEGDIRPLEYDMHVKDFSEANRTRCEAPNGFKHNLYDWSMSDWFVAVTGELGEAGNIVKKLNRVRDNISGNRQAADVLLTQLAEEIADTYIYLDLFCQRVGIDLGKAVQDKFNAKSKEIGYPIMYERKR